MNKTLSVGFSLVMGCGLMGCPQETPEAGKTADPTDPPVEHTRLTVSKAYWFHSKERPSSIPDKGIPQDDDGHVLLHVDEWNKGQGIEQYKAIYEGIDRAFVLKAKDKPDVKANAERGYWSQEFYVRIPAAEMAKMAPGVAYTLHPANGKEKYEWAVKEGVTLSKP